MATRHLTKAVVGIAPTNDGRGYWLAAADGGIFAFGNARFRGSLATMQLTQPIVGITPSRSGNGYRMVGGDGGIFDFGDAKFHGSLGGRGITDVVGMALTPSGEGYWLLRRLGETCSTLQAGSFPCPAQPANFGDAMNLRLSFCCPPPDSFDADFIGNPVVAIVSSPGGQGYAVLRAEGDLGLTPTS
jgi:hypothetical protein